MKVRDEELQMLHDGELSGREARAAEERAAASPEDRVRLEALREVGEVMRARFDLAAEEASPRLDALWSQIERELEPEPAGAHRAARPARSTIRPCGWRSWRRGRMSRGYRIPMRRFTATRSRSRCFGSTSPSKSPRPRRCFCL